MFKTLAVFLHPGSFIEEDMTMRIPLLKRHPVAKTPAPHLTIRQPRIHPEQVEDEESLVIDQRSELQPSQAVEEKLRILMKNKSLPLSTLRLSQAGQQRRHC